MVSLESDELHSLKTNNSARSSNGIRGLKSNRRARRILGSAFAIGVLAFGVYVISGQSGELGGSLELIESAQWPYIVVAIFAEGASVLAFGIFTILLLRTRLLRTGFFHPVAISIATTTINNCVPGGTAFSSIYSFREYRQMGADSIFDSWVIISTNLLSGAGLAVLALIGVFDSIRSSEFLDLILVIPGVLVVMVGLSWLISSPSILIKIIRPSLGLTYRLIRLPRGGIGEVDALCQSFQETRPTLRRVLLATFVATLNWVFDASVLVLAYYAINQSIPWRGLLLAYGAGQLAANLPITPGGLGVVEGSLSIALVAYGGAQESAVAAVLIYRLISFWMTIPIGWGAYLWTSFARRRSSTPIAESLPVEILNGDLNES